MKIKSIMLIILLALTSSIVAKKADLIIFSYNRPMQLYALLESIETYVTNLGEMRVIYRVSDERYQASYIDVQKKFPGTVFMRQGADPKADFKPLTLQAIFQSPSEYILFAVDDNVVTNVIDLGASINALEKTNAYGFYYKLGLHLTECYSHGGVSQKVPPYKNVYANVYAWRFNTGQSDWCYPNSLDMVLYRKQDIKNDFLSLDFQSPTSLEGNWACWIVSNKIMNRFGIFYGHTKMINIPLNLVQDELNNPNMNLYLVQELLEKFEAGLKIDIKPLFNFTNKAVHTAYEPTFIER